MEANQAAEGNKDQLKYATNGKPIPGPAGFKPDKKAGPDDIEEDVDTENGLAKPAKKLNKEEKQEAADIKEHPEKECESLKKSPPGEEETKQEKVNDPAPMYEKPADKPRKKKPVKKKAAAAGAAAPAKAAATSTAKAPAATPKPATPAKAAPAATAKVAAKKDAPKKKVNLMTTEDPAEKVEQDTKSLDEETGNVKEVNKVTGKADKIPAFMDDDKKESFVQKQLKK